MKQINDLTLAFIECVIPNITKFFELERETGRGSRLLTPQQHSMWLLDNLHRAMREDPQVFGAMVLFAPLARGVFEHVLSNFSTYSDVFIAGCFDTSLIEALCRPQPPSTYTFLEKLDLIINWDDSKSSPSKWFILHSHYTTDAETYKSIIEESVDLYDHSSLTITSCLDEHSPLKYLLKVCYLSIATRPYY